MNQDQFTYEEGWIAKLSQRNHEYAKLAYEHLKKNETEQATAYLCYLIGSLESLKDMYPVPSGSTEPAGLMEPPKRRPHFDIKKILLGD